jgi:periplasmic protein TonB
MAPASAPIPALRRDMPAVPDPPRPPAEYRFHNLVVSEPTAIWRGRSATVSVSVALHVVLIASALIVPLFMDDILPAPGEVVRAFFVTPAEVAPPPPPPPPPPPAGVRVAKRAPVAPQPAMPAKFVAPIEVPDLAPPEESLSLLGVEGGVAGGVEGGVPGGVVGGIVGGLPAEAPPPPKVVRIGGHLLAPKLVHKVDPVYPELAQRARLQAMLILEAWVDKEGRVKSVKVLRGMPLLDEPALEAVKQWRYRPLFLNGEATEFVLTVNISFKLQTAGK